MLALQVPGGTSPVSWLPLQVPGPAVAQSLAPWQTPVPGLQVPLERHCDWSLHGPAKTHLPAWQLPKQPPGLLPMPGTPASQTTPRQESGPPLLELPLVDPLAVLLRLTPLLPLEEALPVDEPPLAPVPLLELAHSQVPYPLPAASQTCPPWQPPIPAHATDAPGTQTRLDALAPDEEPDVEPEVEPEVEPDVEEVEGRQAANHSPSADTAPILVMDDPLPGSRRGEHTTEPLGTQPGERSGKASYFARSPAIS